MDNTEYFSKIQIELTKLLYKQIPVGLWAESVAAISFAIAQWNCINIYILSSWLIFNLVMCGFARHLLVYFFNKNIKNNLNHHNYKSWITFFAIGVILSGISWGLIGSIFLFPNNMVHQKFSFFLLMGVTAAANPLYSPNRLIYAIFLSMALIPFAITEMLSGSIFIIIGALVFVYMIIMLVISNDSHQLLTTSLKLRYKNVSLVNNLSKAKFDLEERKIDLEKSILIHKSLEQKLFYQANFDSLTGLPNRALAQYRLEQAISDIHYSKGNMGILFLDIDHFKLINDTYGHLIADKLLAEVAIRLSQCVRDNDTVARVGGDEFIIILASIKHHEAVEIVTLCLERMREPFIIDDKTVHMTMSAGISIYPKDGFEAEILIHNADMAMYRAKESGRNNFQLYTKEMNQRILMRLAMENQLRLALQENQFTLVYQPIISLKTKTIVGLEALLRWHHPKMGLLSPSSFIPVAEESGIIVALGEWVLRSACEQAQKWRQEGLPPIHISVNLSARQFLQSNLFERINTILRDTKFDPKFLTLELTESILIYDMEKNIELLTQLKKMGIGIVIDDFGVGYSSLSYLQRLPVDKLKIDKSFVDEISKLPGTTIIISTIIALAASLHLKVIAEGVENIQQLNFLIKNDCDEIQGFYFSEPLKEEDCKKLLRENRIFE